MFNLCGEAVIVVKLSQRFVGSDWCLHVRESQIGVVLLGRRLGEVQALARSL